MGNIQLKSHLGFSHCRLASDIQYFIFSQFPSQKKALYILFLRLSEEICLWVDCPGPKAAKLSQAKSQVSDVYLWSSCMDCQDSINSERLQVSSTPSIQKNNSNSTVMITQFISTKIKKYINNEKQNKKEITLTYWPMERLYI